MTEPNTSKRFKGNPGRPKKAHEPIPDLSFEEWLAEMNRLMDAFATPERGKQLSAVTAHMCYRVESMVDQPHNVRRMVEVALRLQQISGPLSTYSQKTILRALRWLALDCAESLMDLDLPCQKTIADLVRAVPPAYKPCAKVLGILHDFAYACLHLVKPRDSFASDRNGEALGILGQMADLVELSEALAFARKALTKSEAAAKGASEFMRLYNA